MPMSEAAMRRLYGTSVDARAPWETYDEAMDPMRGCPQHLREAVADYSLRRHMKTSSQNLEELCRQKEMSTEMVKACRFEHQDDLASEGPERVGQIMNILDFWKKLQTIVPCYISSVVRKGMVGLAVLKPSEAIDPETGQSVKKDWQYVCAVQVGYMHEYSTLHTDSHGLPLNEKWRGWRGTVLLRLITGGFITEADAHRVFGEPTSGPASRGYREALFHYRNRGN
jgi:hypothetical protein